jgi:hypothetical protein
MDATTSPTLLDDLVARADEAFRGVQQRVFADDPAINPRLRVEALEACLVDGVPTLLLIAPWTLNGLLFPTGAGPAELTVAGAVRRAYRGDVPPLGVYWSVNLVADVSRLASPRQARTLAQSYVGSFREAVRVWLGTTHG